AGQVDLRDRGGLEGAEVGEGVEVEVVGAHVEVVDVAQQLAAGGPRERVQEIGLADGRVPELQVGGGIFQQDAAAPRVLRPREVGADEAERLFRVRQRQQVV